MQLTNCALAAKQFSITVYVVSRIVSDYTFNWFVDFTYFFYHLLTYLLTYLLTFKRIGFFLVILFVNFPVCLIPISKQETELFIHHVKML